VLRDICLHCIVRSKALQHHVKKVSLLCRLYAARGVVDGHGLLHELMADVIQDLSGQGQTSSGQGSADGTGGPLAADSWVTVSSVTPEVCRDNAVGE